MTDSLHRIILDTDVGTDVDDAMALAVIFGSEDIDLVGVTTVYGDTMLRARLAQRYARIAGRRVTAVPGAGLTWSGKDVWWPGHEGSLHADLDVERVASLRVADFLTTEVGRATTDVVAIGPLTNIADAVRRRRFCEEVSHLWVMGGSFDGSSTEHNIRSDIDAAREVFASGVPTTVISLDVTQKFRVYAEQLEQIGSSGPLGAALTADVNQWRALWGGEWNVPHDPIAVLAMSRPDLFTLSAPGHVMVDEVDGRTTFVAAEAGTTRVVIDLDVEAVTKEMVRRIVAASAA